MVTTTEPPPTTRIQRWKSFRFRDWVRTLISPGDSAHQLACGASIGVFVAFTPLLGLHFAIIVLLAFVLQRVVRFNKALAVATSYVSNPLTFAPILWASYEVGAGVVPAGAGRFNLQEMSRAFDWRGGIQSIPGQMLGIGMPMLVGSLILGGSLAVATYPLALAIVTWYRRRLPLQDPALEAGNAEPAGGLVSQTLCRAKSQIGNT